MADFKTKTWLDRNILNAAYVDRPDISVDALNILIEVIPTLDRSMHLTGLNVGFLTDPTVPYAAAAKLFAAFRPASAKETAAFLCRPDIPAADAVRIVASERRMTVLLPVAELTGRDPAVYEAVVSAFGEAIQKTSTGSSFKVLLALLTNPDVPSAAKVAAVQAPSADAWDEHAGPGTAAVECWEILKSSELLQIAAFDGLRIPDSMLPDCALWQGLSTAQLRVVFASLQRQVVRELVPGPACNPARFTTVDSGLDLDALLCVCDHVAATDEFLAEVDDWFDEFLAKADSWLVFEPDPCPDPYFWFTFGKHRRQGLLHVDPAEFWAAYPQKKPDSLTLFEWSCWTRIPSIPQLVDVLVEMPDDWTENVCAVSWLVPQLMPLTETASSADLLAGLDAAAASGIPDVLSVVEDLCWTSASYEVLTFDVLRRLRQPDDQCFGQSSSATMRLLELFAATIGPDPALWQVFEKVSVSDATIGEILDLATEILEPCSV